MPGWTTYAKWGAGAAVAGGVGMMGIHAALHPIDTITGGVKKGVTAYGIATDPSALAATAATVAPLALAAGGVGLAAWKGRNVLKNAVYSSTPSAPGNWALNGMARTGYRTQEMLGGFNTHMGIAAGGLMFGALAGTFFGSLNRYTSQQAMASSQTGSAYSGDGGFGSRKSGVRALGQSTMGLVGGLHASR